MDEKCNILCWKPGDPLTQVRRVVGEGARVSGIKDLGMGCDFSISPTGEIIVADYQNETLVSFRNGSGHLVLDELQGSPVSSCSPSGILYALTDKALRHDLRESSRRPAVLVLSHVCDQGRGHLCP